MPLKFGPSPLSLLLFAFAGVVSACAAGEAVDEGEQFGSFGSPTTQSDPDEETGDGEATSDGDGDPSTGDGDGDPTTGDGDGDPTTGDGDGDPSTGDGDGDMSSCGDGQVSGTEACDGANLDGQTCTSLGYSGGTLTCNGDCTLNIGGCTNASCGNGSIEGIEVCDGAALNGQTCVSQGFSGGTLACNPTCNGYNTAGCSMGAACGNGVIEGSEVCDGAALNGQSCASVGYAGGNLACNADCSNYNPAGCNDGNCCVEFGHVGCQVPFVEDCVCGWDAYCCATEWDDICVGIAINDCAAAC